MALSTMHRQTLFTNPENVLCRKLTTAMQYAINTCTLGTDNRYDDFIKTSGWNNFQRYRYHINGRYVNRKDGHPNSIDRRVNASLKPGTNEMAYCKPQSAWFYRLDDCSQGFEPTILLTPKHAQTRPLDDPQFRLSLESYFMLSNAILAATKRTGNCRERADLVMKYLWEHPAGIFNIEVVTTQTFDHCFVIVNRKGELRQPSTWGNAWIIDPWYESSQHKGLMMRGIEIKHYLRKIKAFAKDEAAKLHQLGITVKPISDDTETLKRVEYAIHPGLDRYPTYSTAPFYPVEYYYDIINAYPTDLQLDPSNRPLISTYLNEHRSRFKLCLTAIEHLTDLNAIRLV